MNGNRSWLIVTPAPAGSTIGNRITAERWAEMLEQLGCRIRIAESTGDLQLVGSEGLIALHARRSADAIRHYRERIPHGPVVVAMTGTDLHGDLASADPAPRRTVLRSLDVADRIVLLEPAGLAELNPEHRAKATVIRQSAQPARHPGKPIEDAFEVTLIGHLRSEKDPFLAPRAVADLPPDSRVRLIHIGSARDPSMASIAQALMKANPRYRWLGELSHDQTLSWLTRSRLTVLTSRAEGGPAVVSEAIVNGVPILASRIVATEGLMGPDYPGFFPVGDHAALQQLLLAAERDPRFLDRLNDWIERLAPQFTANRERESWRQLLDELTG